MTNAQRIQIQTAQIADLLGIADQIHHMNSAEALREMARRFALIRKQQAVQLCNELATLAEKYAA